MLDGRELEIEGCIPTRDSTIGIDQVRKELPDRGGQLFSQREKILKIFFRFLREKKKIFFSRKIENRKYFIFLFSQKSKKDFQKRIFFQNLFSIFRKKIIFSKSFFKKPRKDFQNLFSLRKNRKKIFKIFSRCEKRI